MKRYNRSDFEFIDTIDEGTSASFIGRNKITGRKGIYKDNGCMLKISNEDVREKLANDILNLLDIKCAQIDLIYDEQLGQNACFSNYVIDDEERLIEPKIYKIKDDSKDCTTNFINGYLKGVQDITKDINFSKSVKKNLCEYLYISCIIDSYDIKSDNIPIVENMISGEKRICPWFDFGIAFKENAFQKKGIFNDISSDEVLNELFNNYYNEIFDISTKVKNRLSKRQLNDILSQNYIEESFSKEEIDEIKNRLEHQVQKSNQIKSKMSKSENKFLQNNSFIDNIKQKLLGIKNIFVKNRNLLISENISKNSTGVLNDNMNSYNFENECKNMTKSLNEMVDQTELESDNLTKREVEEIKNKNILGE